MPLPTAQQVNLQACSRRQALNMNVKQGSCDLLNTIFAVIGLTQGCELDRFLTEFEFKRYLQVRVQVRVLRILFFEFKFEFGKNDRVQRVRVQVRVRSSGLYKSQWHEQINDMHLFF